MWDSNIFETPLEVTDWLNENRNHIIEVSITYSSMHDRYIIFYLDIDLVEEGS